MSTALIAQLGYDLIKIAERNGSLDRFRDMFRKKHRVLILGSTGTGKTQFVTSCAQIFADALDHVARTEFPNTNRTEIGGKLFEFIDTPGQEYHVSRRVDAIREAINKGMSGVINLTCYGYHEYGVDKSEVIIDKSVSEKYLKSHREVELILLREWVHLLRNEWILTVVSKADIWWDQRDNILQYYNSGEYNDVLFSLNKHMENVIAPYSSITNRFYNEVPCSGNFDDTQRKLYRQKLFKTLLEAITRVGE